jgi:hypothetical protein
VNARRDAAQRYARAGWPVFPCLPERKEPMTRHGVHDAETSPGVIARWWSRHPDANVAIATGEPGPTVLDVDVANGKPGHKSLNAAIRAGLVPQPQASIKTPSGGSHLYFLGDAQGNAAMPRHGLDLRGRGGYVVAAPSTVGGRPYVVVSHSPDASGRIDSSRSLSGLRGSPAVNEASPTWPAGSPDSRKATGTRALSGQPAGRLRRGTPMPWLRSPGPPSAPDSLRRPSTRPSPPLSGPRAQKTRTARRRARWR